MELFKKAKEVRLRSHHDKFLIADEDEESVIQDRNGDDRNAKWTVEFKEEANVLRFKSCYGKYLTASNQPFLLGFTGKRVLQTLPSRLDSSVEWEPISEGFQVRLKTRYGQYLRANSGLPPWRNSVTHDIPHRSATQDWVLWDVHITDTWQTPPPRPKIEVPEPAGLLDFGTSEPDLSTAIDLRSPNSSHIESSGDIQGSPPRAKERIIYYYVADESSDVDGEELSFTFKGSGVEELKQRLAEETNHNDIIVCSRSPFNGKLYPLKLHLPPNNIDLHVVVVPSSSKASKDVQLPLSPPPS